jgi:hypothetical protein
MRLLTRLFPVAASGWILGACLGAKDTPDTQDTAPQAQFIQDCTTAVGGADWDENGPFESIGGVEAELANLDLASLPDTLDISEVLALYRGYIAYALDIPPADLGDTLERDDILAKGDLGRGVAGALLQGDDLTGIDFIFFRRAFHRYYTCSRGFPATLADFVLAYGDYSGWEPNDVDSLAKCGTRRLRRNHEAAVYVAETLVGTEVRETEILLGDRREDGAFDFLVYDTDGLLSDRSRFPTLDNGPSLVAAAPYVCTSCHVDHDAAPTTWGFGVQTPDVGPCAR